MASFGKLLFAFLLLNVLSNLQAEDDCLSCSKHNTARLGEGIMIKCKTKGSIICMGMGFLPLKGDHYFPIGVISQSNSVLNDDGTTLEFHGNAVSLSINQTKLSHEGNYELNYITENCMNEMNISLEVFAPYTGPQIMGQKDALICTASGGYPEEKLYWVSKTGTNLTNKSTPQSVKNEDGSFNLSNTLQLESAPSETEYCCIFNHTRFPSRQPASACTILGNVSTSKNSRVRTEETTLNMTQKIVIGVVLISLASILLAVMWRRIGRKKYFLQKWQKFSRANELTY